ncbi:hypothetical protein [Halogeometricum limi]|uniref:Sulfatase n=1 Tax=Halogeometricum limi TaxID=555875 RepID=A0A1I6IKY3_9EURY|nr:hypothetical protein [Halogeometricum limi]SFR67299.1 hypothetical protein SAMN04488124_3345 [Halogeometricum limi]
METDVRAWIEELSSGLKGGGSKKQALLWSLRGAFNGPYLSWTARHPIGTNVYERDWDLLIVLDACRLDALREVAPEYDYIQSVDSIWSVGSASHEWICKTFTNEYRSEIEQTSLITTNPFVPQTFDDRVFPPKAYAIPVMWPQWDVVEKSTFQNLLQIHKHDYEEYFSAPPPEIVTDHAIKMAREDPSERMVLHYFQPHTPYISHAHREKRPITDLEDDPWAAMQNGTATKEEAWELYMDNLRFVLDNIRTLLRNIDAEKVVITADHGDLFGEMGAYGHPEGFVHPDLKRVPWAIASGTDTGERQPDVETSRQTDGDHDVEDRLEKLGYL